jgi:hypothetical protein
MTDRPTSDPASDSASDPDGDLTRALRRSRVLEDAPEPVIQRVIDSFQARARVAAAPTAGGPLQRFMAVLGFDSAGATPQLAGLRSVGSTSRQMLFTAEGRDVDLRITPAPGGWQIGGQILGPDETGRVELQGDGYRAVAVWNDLAEFRFDAVPAGSYLLVLRSADWELVLPEIRIPGDADASDAGAA